MTSPMSMMSSGRYGWLWPPITGAYSMWAREGRNVIGLINAQLGTEINQKYIENPIKNYVRDTLADTSKCREALEFEARISLEEGNMLWESRALPPLLLASFKAERVSNQQHEKYRMRMSSAHDGGLLIAR